MIFLYDGRNPLWLGFIFVGYLLFKAVWVQLDIATEFQNGAVSNFSFITVKMTLLALPNIPKSCYICYCCYVQLPGILSISTKILPIVINFVRKVAEEGQFPASDHPIRNPELSESSSSDSSSGVLPHEHGTEVSSSSKKDE